MSAALKINGESTLLERMGKAFSTLATSLLFGAGGSTREVDVIEGAFYDPWAGGEYLTAEHEETVCNLTSTAWSDSAFSPVSYHVG